MARRLFPRLVRHRRRAGRLPRNVQACASLIGRCTSLPTSLTRVVACVVASLVSYRLRIVFGAQCVAIVRQSILLADFYDCKLRKSGKMDRRCSYVLGDESSHSESSGSSDFHGDNLPSPDVVRSRTQPKWYTENGVQTECSEYAGPFRGLGIPN